VHKKLEGGTAGTADPNRPKGYPIPYIIALSNESRGKEEEGKTFGVTAFVFPNSYSA